MEREDDVMRKNPKKATVKRADSYEKALQYLNNLKTWTRDDFLRVLQIAGEDFSDVMGEVWETPESLSKPKAEALKKRLKEALEHGIIRYRFESQWM